MFRKLSLLVGTATMSMMASAPVLAGSGNADKELPFGYSYSIVDQQGPGAPCEVPGEVLGNEVSFTAIGQALHMGQSVADVDFCVGADPTGQLRSYGTVELTAANGDWISFEFRGTPIDSVSATAEIIPETTDGEGRFANADVTGAGFAGQFGGYFDGTIAYNASDVSG